MKKFLFLILLSFFFLVPNVYADSSSINFGALNVDLTSASSNYTWNASTPNVWSNWGMGTLTASGTLYNRGTGSSTSSLMILKSVIAFSDNNQFVCDVGSYSINNSTYVGQTFTIKCPMKMTSGGFQKLLFNFESNDSLETLYRLSVTGVVTYSQDITRVDAQPFLDSISGNTALIVSSQNSTTSSINNNTTAVNNQTTSINNQTNEIKKTNDNIMNDDITDSSTTASGFFDDFTQNSHGLSGIITAPLRLINALLTAQCRPLTFTLPFDDHEVSLQCMRPIYENYFGVFFTLFQLITTGMISYHILINIYKKVRDLQNPKNDRIEVLNL